MGDPSYSNAIELHYVAAWSLPVDRVRLMDGNIAALPPEFQVLVVPRSPEMTAYATRCMSQPDDPERLELYIVTRPSDEALSDVVEVLTSVAHYHRTGSPLALGHTVNLGRPWLPGSTCTHGLVSLPYLDGPGLEWMEEPKVRFLWLIPITEAELAFKKLHGMEALEEKFEETRFDFLDPRRRSVV